MRICVYGAGAIGGYLAASLARGGAELCLVGRGAHLAAIQARGLTIHTPNESFTVRMPASDDPAAFGHQDVVMVTAKAPALPSIAAGIAPLLGPETPVVFIGNGIPWWYFDGHGGPLDGQRLESLDPGDAMRRAVGPARSIGSVVYAACTVVEPGVIEMAAAPTGRLILGELDGRMTERLQAIAAPVQAGGVLAEPTPRIRDAVWTKLMRNLGGSPASVLAMVAPQEVYTDPACEAAARASFTEVGAIAAALGCKLDYSLDNLMGVMQAMHHRPSILQDLERSRPMEVDAIFDAPLRLARMVGVATPVLDLLVALIKVRAREAGLYDA